MESEFWYFIYRKNTSTDSKNIFFQNTNETVFPYKDCCKLYKDKKLVKPTNFLAKSLQKSIKRYYQFWGKFFYNYYFQYLRDLAWKTRQKNTFFQTLNLARSIFLALKPSIQQTSLKSLSFSISQNIFYTNKYCSFNSIVLDVNQNGHILKSSKSSLRN